jgi:hypothetical protein
LKQIFMLHRTTIPSARHTWLKLKPPSNPPQSRLCPSTSANVSIHSFNPTNSAKDALRTAGGILSRAWLIHLYQEPRNWSENMNTGVSKGVWKVNTGVSKGVWKVNTGVSKGVWKVKQS